MSSGSALTPIPQIILYVKKTLKTGSDPEIFLSYYNYKTYYPYRIIKTFRKTDGQKTTSYTTGRYISLFYEVPQKKVFF